VILVGRHLCRHFVIPQLLDPNNDRLKPNLQFIIHALLFTLVLVTLVLVTLVLVTLVLVTLVLVTCYWLLGINYSGS